MANRQANVPGKATLEEQQNTLNKTERVGALMLVSYVRANVAGTTPKHENTATFTRRDQTNNELPLLTLAEIPDNRTESEVLKDFPGNQKVTLADIWVSDVIKKVLVLR
jgi:hypothetical protein